jgi:hypothetical protein
MSTHEVGISDFFWAKNRQMANFIFKMAKIGCFLGFLVNCPASTAKKYVELLSDYLFVTRDFF